jgi:hypothetical protein
MTDPQVDTIEFRVIGEMKSDPDHLLLSDEDGHWYGYRISTGTIVPVEPSDFWTVDRVDNPGCSVAPPAPRGEIDQGCHTAWLPNRQPARSTPCSRSGVPHAGALW